MYEFATDEAFGAQMLRAELPLLGEQWDRLGAPIARVLAPGIDPDEVDRLTEPYGLRVPAEVRALWEWHNGILPGVLGQDYSIGPGGYEFLSVERALEEYTRNREIHPQEAAEEMDWPDGYWHPSWLPLFVQGPQRLIVDCDRTVELWPGVAPLRLVDWSWEAYNVDVATSLHGAVRTWTWLLQQDYYRIVRVGERMNWEADPLAIPLFLRVSGLS